MATATYEKPGANHASVSALKGYKESFVFQIITRKNSTVVKYARDVLCYALTPAILAARKGNQMRYNMLLNDHKLLSFFFFKWGNNLNTICFGIEKALT